MKYNKSVTTIASAMLFLTLSSPLMGMSWFLNTTYNAAHNTYKCYKYIQEKNKYIQETNLIETAVTHPKVEPLLNQKALPAYAAWYAATGYSFAGPALKITQGSLGLSLDLLKWGVKKGIYATTGYAPKIVHEHIEISDGGLPIDHLEDTVRRQIYRLTTQKTNWLRYAAGAYALSCGVYHVVKWSKKIQDEANATRAALKESEKIITEAFNAQFNDMKKQIDEKILTKDEFKKSAQEMKKTLNNLLSENKITQNQYKELQQDIKKTISEFEAKMNTLCTTTLDTNTQVKISNMSLDDLENCKNETENNLYLMVKDYKNENELVSFLKETNLSNEYVYQVNLLRMMEGKIKEKTEVKNFYSMISNNMNTTQQSQLKNLENNTGKIVITTHETNDSVNEKLKLINATYISIKTDMLLNNKQKKKEDDVNSIKQNNQLIKTNKENNNDDDDDVNLNDYLDMQDDNSTINISKSTLDNKQLFDLIKKQGADVLLNLQQKDITRSAKEEEKTQLALSNNQEENGSDSYLYNHYDNTGLRNFFKF